MSNLQILEERKRDLVRARRGYENSTDPAMKAHYNEIMEWCEFEIDELQGAIAMGADEAMCGLSGFC